MTRATQWMPLMRASMAVHMELLSEQQAQKNHGQSLDRLAERGGLSLCEALALVERRRWRPAEEHLALQQLHLLASTTSIEAASVAEKPPSADELREWASHPAATGYVPVHPATLRAIAKDLERWRDAYENMRDFAQANGLDTTARN